jgi:hypothetical protein
VYHYLARHTLTKYFGGKIWFDAGYGTQKEANS